MTHQSKPQPQFLTPDIQSCLEYFLENILLISCDNICHANCKDVYITLVEELQQIIDSED